MRTTTRTRRLRAVALTGLTAVTVALGLVVAPGATASDEARSSRPGWGPVKEPVAVGRGGAVATVDLDASLAGLQVLRLGGNAADAAVAAAAALGVTEPFSAGIGGGGYFVYYDAASGEVTTVDGRETAPAAFTATTFVDPATGAPYPFADAVTSGLSVGVPGTPATWATVNEQFGSRPLAALLLPAVGLAHRGFEVDETFNAQVAANAGRFATFSSTSELYLPGGAPPEVGSTFRNPDLGRTYLQLAFRGVDAFYAGAIAEDVVSAAAQPPLAPGAEPVLGGLLSVDDLASYETLVQPPTVVSYRGLDVYGMAPSSSGGTTVGESLNIVENVDLAGLAGTDPAQARHYTLEANRAAFADRNRYVGDPAFLDDPAFEDAAGGPAWRQLLEQSFADERFCTIDPGAAATSPVPPGSPDGAYSPSCDAPAAGAEPAADTSGPSTTHLVTSDRWGNVASYTLTIEQTGGNGLVVPDRGFLLNNELTDFNFAPPASGAPDPNLPAPGKRPRSSMSPTIVLREGEPFLALGSPGGSTIITTVTQVLSDRVDLGLSLADAVAAPRASQRNTAAALAEPAFIESPTGQELQARFGHAFTPTAEIGAVAALEFLDDGRVVAVAEPERRGGGSALVVRGSRRGGH